MANTYVQVTANLPPANECQRFPDNRSLLEYVASRLRVPIPTSSEVTLSFGPTPPEGIQGRATALHIETNQVGNPVAIQVYAAGAWRDLYRQVVGELRWFPIGGEPTGWLQANGLNGTPDLSGEAYYSPLPGTVMFIYRG